MGLEYTRTASPAHSGQATDEGAVPIGSVTKVFSSPREQAKHAVIDPYVDFSSLDVVGVVVADDTKGDRAVIRAGEVDPAGSDDAGGR